MNGQRKEILCNAILLGLLFLVPCAYAEDWGLQYDANRLNPDAEQPTAGWEAHSSSPSPIARVENGILHMETKVDRGGLWFGMKQKSDAWAKAIAPGRDWSAEARVKVLKSSAADGGFTLWIGNGNRQTAYLVIGAGSLKWGMKNRGQVVLDAKVNNHSDFHTYRVDYTAKSQTFTVYRDRKRIKSGLTNASPYPYRWFVFGDPGSTCQMSAQLDWIRYKTQKGPPMYTVVAFGDSTTAPGNNVKSVYSEYLPGSLKKKSVSVGVVNSGRAGLHSGRSGAYPAFGKKPQALDIFQNEVVNFGPDITVIQFGINDAWIDGKNPTGPSRTKPEDFAYNMDTMILTAIDSGSKVVLMTPNPLGKGFEKWRDDRLATYAQIVRNIAKREGLPLVDVRRMFQEYGQDSRKDLDDLLQDGMHPNHIGQKMIADELAVKIGAIFAPKKFRKVDLAKTLPTKTIASANGVRLVQANTAKLPGDRLVAVFQKRTDKSNEIMFARSDNSGLAWNILPTPSHFDGLDVNTPTIHAAGDSLFLFVSYPRMSISHSTDAGTTWSPLYPLFPPNWTGRTGDGGVLPPASLLSNGSNLILMWHDATTLKPSINFGLFQSISTDAGRKWSTPEQVGIHPKLLGARPADPVLIPNPHNGELLCLAKDASRKYAATWMVSANNGANWSDLNATSALLAGDRHAAIRTRDGRLAIVFRDRNKASKWFGDTVVWIGTDDDLKGGLQGQYLARIMENPGAGGTADIEQLTDGSFVVTSAYSFKTSGAVRCARFTVEQLDFAAASGKR